MMIAQEIYAAEGDTIPPLEPPLPLLLPPPMGEDGDEHALPEEGGLLDEVDYCESSRPFPPWP